MNEKCPKCKRGYRSKPDNAKLTKHHILPKRFYGTPPNALALLICRGCHNDLEKTIAQDPKMDDEYYWNKMFDFLQTTRVRVVTWSGNDSYFVYRSKRRFTLSLPELAYSYPA